jgi:hypothetical protein
MSSVEDIEIVVELELGMLGVSVVSEEVELEINT